MTSPPTEHRSRTMRAVKGRDTAPEMLVRRLTFSMGYRYRLYQKDLPGKPDLAFPGRRKVVFIHGCFWHGHDCARGARPPKQNAEYWSNKIARNKARDVVHLAKLQTLGWESLVIWECELKDQERLRDLLSTFLG
ncbi:MAG TPA: very short patch repair endonuclease [Burkholderiales bacterium]|nr:very short patch repair endonuclease [Burkholderiales bacterium]